MIRKKILAMIAAAALMMTFGTAASADFAAENPAEIPATMSEREVAIAYMDTEQAAPVEKAEILKARNEIIFNNSWTAEGYDGFLLDTETGEEIATVPHFHDIFPEDWELPVDGQ